MPHLKDRGLPLTALADAAGRAVETSRPDGLVADPFALAFVDAAQSHVDFPTSWPADPEAAPPLQQPLLHHLRPCTVPHPLREPGPAKEQPSGQSRGGFVTAVR